MKNTNKANYFFQSRVDLKPRKESIDRINDYHSVLSAFIFLGEENKLKVSEINDALKSLKNHIVGGLFTGLLFGGENYDNGSLVLGLPYALDTKKIDLSDEVIISEGVRFFYKIVECNDKLLHGTTDARDKRVSDAQNAMFCIDCFSRGLYVVDYFYEEIATIDRAKNIFWFLSLGEIVNFETNLEIFNKTVTLNQFSK